MKKGVFGVGIIASALMFSASGYAFAGILPEEKSLFQEAADWRHSMSDKGYQMEAGYVNQAAHLVDGGYSGEHPTKFIDQFHFKFNVDLAKIAGIEDAVFEALFVNRNHDENLSNSDIYDPGAPRLNSTQESHGRGSIWRLGLFSYRQSFLDKKLKIRAGLINKVWDFDNATPCDFQSSLLCAGKSGRSAIWYNWNVAQWGVSAQYQLSPQWIIKTGLYDQNPSRQERSQAFSFSTSGSQGIIVPLELEYRPTFGNGKLHGIYEIGTTYSNADSKDVYLASNDQPYALFPQLDYKIHHDQQYIYWNFTQQISQKGASANDGMHLFFTGGIGGRTKHVKANMSAGLRYPGILSQRPKDSFGIGVSYSRLNKDYVSNAHLMNQVNAGIEGFSPLPIRDSAEMVSEVYYNVQVTPAISIQPGLQYWRKPAGLAETPNAVVLGLKMMALF